MKRCIYALLAVFLLAGLCASYRVQTDAASVKVSYKGKTTSYAQKKTYAIIDGKRKNLSSTPIFLKSGSLVGPVYGVFKNSPLKINYTTNSKSIKIKYNNKTIKMTNGSRNIVVNGNTEKNALLSAPMKGAKYTATGKTRWIVPIKSVCSRLGLTYEYTNGVVYIKDPAYVKKETENAAAQAKKTVSASTVAAATTAANTNTTPAAKKFVLVLDAGHGGTDSGAVNSSLGLKEKNMTLAILLGAKKYFDTDSRFQVYYTRTADTYPSLSDRYKLANNVKADLFISVHINSASASATGTETLYSNARSSVTGKNGITSKALAAAMQQAAVKTTGFPNRGLSDRPNLQVLKYTEMPSCLIEYGFISNATEARKMNTNTARYGKELYEALVNYLKSQGKIS